MGLEDAREDNLDMASREEAVAVVPPGEVEVAKMESGEDFLVHGARKSTSGFTTDVVAEDIGMTQSQVAVARSVNSTAEAPVSAGTEPSADVDTGPGSSSDVEESTKKVESSDLNKVVEESAGSNENPKPNFAEGGTLDYIKTQASPDLITDAPTSAASVQDSAGGSAVSIPFADVEEKAVEVSSEDAEVVSKELNADVAASEEVSSKILDEGFAEKRDNEASAVPVEEVKLVAQEIIPVNPNEAIATLEAAPSRSVDVQERCVELDNKDAGALNDDVSPPIEDSGSAKKDDSEALTDRVEGYQEITDTATSANPDEDTPSLEASISPSVNIGEESVELRSKDVGPVSEGVGLSIVGEGLTEKGDNQSPSAPLEIIEKVEDASTRTEPDEHLASLNEVPSSSVDVGVKSTDLESNESRALNEHISPLINEGGSAEISESEAPEAAVEEVHGLAEGTTSAALDDDGAGLKAALSPSTNVGEPSVKLDSEDVGAVSDDVSTLIQDEESADKGDNDAPVAPVEGACEIPEAKMSAEPDEAVGSLDAEPPPSAYVGVKSAELDSEGTRALNADNGPPIQEEEPAEKGDADAAEAPLQEAHDVAAATSSVEADPDAASVEAAPSPSVAAGDKSAEQNFEGAGAESDDASLKSEGEGSAKKGESTTTEAPAKEANEPAGVAPNVELEEDSASVDAPPSSSVGLTSVEADAGDAGMLNENVSPKIEDEGSAAEKGESKDIPPPEEVNEVAEPKCTAEALEAAPSPFANVEEKSLELDPEVARFVSEGVSHEIQDEGSAEKADADAPEAPLEEVDDVAEAATTAEPLETSLSPVVDDEEEPLELDSEAGRALNVDASTEIEDEGSAAENGENEEIAPPDEVNEVAEPITTAEPQEAAPTPFPNVEVKSFELDPEVAPAGSEDVNLETEGETSAERGDRAVPEEEVREVTEAPTNAEPDEDVAALEAAPSPVVHVEEKPLVLDSEDAVSAGEDVSPEFEDIKLAEKGDREAPEASAEEVDEAAEAATGAEPDEDMATLEASPSPFGDVKEKSFELGSDGARALSVDASPETEAAAERGGSEASAPAEKVNEVAEPLTIAEPLEATPPPLVDVKEKSLELDPEASRRVSEDVSPEIDDEGSAEKGDSAVPDEEVHEVAEAPTNAEPDEDMATLEAAPSPVADVGDESVEQNTKDAGAEDEDASLKTEGEDSAKKCESTTAEAPAKEVNESAGVALSAKPEEYSASLDAPPSDSVGLTSAEADAEDAGTLNENVNQKIEDEESAAEKDESEEIGHSEDVKEVAEPMSIADPLEAASSPSADAEDRSFELDPVVAPVMGKDVSPEIEGEGLAKKGESEVPVAPAEEVPEAAEAATDVEPDEDVVTLEASPLPVTDVGEESVELDSGDAVAAGEDVSPELEDEGSANKGESEALIVPVEVVNEVAEAAAHLEPNETVASLKDMASSSAEFAEGTVDVDNKSVDLADKAVGVKDKDVEVSSGHVEAVTEEFPAEGASSEGVSPTIPDEESAETGGSEAAVAPVEELDEVAEAAASAEGDEDMATVEASPSPFVDVEGQPLELGSEVARGVSVDASREIEAEGSAAEKGESETPAADEVNEVAEQLAIAEPLDTAPPPFVDVEEKSLELAPEVARGVSEDVSPEIEDEGLAAENGESEAPAPVVQLNEVAEAARDFEPDDAMANLETMPSPSAEVQEQPLDVDDKSLDIGFKPVAGEPEPADLADRSGGAGDVAFARDEFYAEDPAIVKESPEILDEASAEQGEIEAHEAPVEEGHEVAETAINAEPDARVASVEATPSPSAHAGGISAQPESDNAVAVGVDVSLQFEDDGSGENGDSEAPEAGVDEVQEVAEATSVAEPAEDASRLDSAISPSLGARERSVEMDSEDSRADASVDVSQNFEDAVLADKGNSAAPEASVEEVCKIPSVTTSAEHNEVEASLETEPSPSVNAGERNIELDHEEAGALNEDVSPAVEDFGSAEKGEKGDSVARETPLEEVHEVAAATSTVEAHSDAASVETAPSSFVDVGEFFDVKDKPVDTEGAFVDVEDKPDGVADNCGDIEEFFFAVNAGDVGVVGDELFAEVPASVEASPNFPGEGSAETIGLEPPTALVEEAQKVAEVANPVQGNETVTNLDAVLPRSADVEEAFVEVDAEDARVVSEDVSPEIEGEGLPEKGSSSAPEFPIEVDQEVAEATTIAQPDEIVASLEAAPSPSVHLREASVDVDSEDPGALNEVSGPLIEAKRPAEKDDTEAAQAPVEESQEVAGTSIKLTAEPDADAASVDAARAPVIKLDSEIAGAMTENVSSKAEHMGLAEEGDSAPPEAPLEETNDVAEATTPVAPVEAVARLEAAPPLSVDVRERYFEQNYDVAGTLDVDSSPPIGDGGSAEQGGSAAADAPVEEDGEVAERTTSVEPFEVLTISVADPAVDARERSVEQSNEDAGALNADVSPNREDKGSAEKDNSEAPDAPLEKVQEFPQAALSSEREVVEASLETDFSPSADAWVNSADVNSEGARALNEDISPTIEESGSDKEGDSEAPKAPLEELHVAALASSCVEADPNSANVEAAPSPSVDLNCEDAGAVREDTIPKVQVEGLAEKVDSAAPEVPAEEGHEITRAAPSAEHEEDGASVNASPSPSVGGIYVTVDAHDAGTLNENVSPKIEVERTVAENGESEALGHAEEVNEVAEPLTIAEPLEAAPPPLVDVKEKSLELDPETVRVVSEDVISEIGDEESAAEKGDSAVPDEEVHEVAEAPTIAEPDEDMATLEAAPSPVADVGDESVELDSEDALTAGEHVKPEFKDEGSADKGESEVPVVPVEEGNNVAEAAAHVGPDEAVPSHEDVPSSPAEFAKEIVVADDKSVDLADKAVGVEDKSVEVSAGDVGAVSKPVPAEVAASEGVSPTIPEEESAETGGSEAAVAPIEELDEVAEAAISAEGDEDVVSLEAAPSSSVDVGEEAVELDSADTRAVSADVSLVTKDGRSIEGGGSPAPEGPLDVDQEVPVASTSVEPDDVEAGLEAETPPSVLSGGEPLDVDSEDAGAVCEDVSPQVGDAGSAGTGEGDAPEAHVEEVQKVADANSNTKPDDASSVETANSPSAHFAETSVELNSEDAGTVSDDVSPVIKDEEWAEKGGSAATEAPAQENDEVAEAKSIIEPQVDSTGLDGAMSPSVVVRERGVELDSVVEGEGWAENRDSGPPEAPLEVNQNAAAEALSSSEPDEVGASMEAEPSPSDNVGTKPLEGDSAGAELGADVSLVVEDDGYAAKGELEAAEAPVEDIHRVAVDPSSCALDADPTSLKAATPYSFDVRERDSELDSNHAGAAIDDVSPVIKDDGWDEKVDTVAPEVPVEVAQEVAESSTSIEPDEVVASLEASPSAFVGVSEKGVELDSDDVGAMSADVIPATVGERSATEGDSAAPEAPVDVNQEVPVAQMIAEREKVVTNLDAESSPSLDDRFDSVEMTPEDAWALNEDIGSLIEEGESGAKGVSETPEAPVEKVNDGPGATPSAELEGVAASLDAAASPAVDEEETSFKVDSEDDETLNENVSPVIKDDGSADKGSGEPLDLPVEEVYDVAEAATSAQPDEGVGSLEAGAPSSIKVHERPDHLDSEDPGAVNENVSPEGKGKGSDDEIDKQSPSAPLEVVEEVEDAATRTEPEKQLASLNAVPSPSVDGEMKSIKLDSEGTRALNADNGPPIQEEEPAEKGDADAAEAPLQEAHDVAAATSSVEADPDAASVEAAPSPSVAAGDKSAEQNFEGAGAESDDASLKSEGEGSAKKGESTTTEAPAKEANEPAGVAPNVELEEDSASVDAPPSSSVGLTSVEADAGDAGMLNENVSPKIEDEGSAAEKGESKDIPPPEEVNEVAEPKCTAEALEAAPSPFANVEEKSLELDPEVARFVSEGVSHEIQDEGSAEKADADAPEAPLEEVDDVAEAATTAEPLETSLSPVVDDEEEPLELDSEAGRALNVDASTEIEDEGSAAENGENEEIAPPDEVNEVAEPITTAEPQEAAPTPFPNVEVKSFELDPEVAPAGSEDVNLETEGETSAERGDRAVPEEEVREVTEAPTNAEPDEDVAALEAAPSPVVHVEEKPLVLDSEDAVSAGEDVSPEFEDIKLAEKGDREAPEASAEEVDEAAEAATGAEPDEDMATLEASPSPFGDVKEKSFELGSDGARALSVDASPETEAAAERGGSEASAPAEKVNEVAEPLTIAEPLEATPPPLVDVKEKSLELDPETVRVVSEDVISEIGDEESAAEKGDSAVPDEEVHEVAEAPTIAEPDEDMATLEAAPSPVADVGDESVELDSEDALTAGEHVKPEFKDEGSADKGESEVPVVPVEEGNNVAEAAAHVGPDEAVPSHEDVPSSPAEFAKEIVVADDKSVDLADKAVGVEDKSVEVSAGDVGAVSKPVPAEVAASEGVSPTIPEEESAETGGSEAAVAPIEELDEVAEAAISAEGDEDVVSLEAAPSSSVDVGEEAVELDSADTRAVSVDGSPETGAEGSVAAKGASAVTEEEIHELLEEKTNAERDEDATTLEDAPSPAVRVEEKPLELGFDVSRASSVDASPNIGVDGSAAENRESEASAPPEEINEDTESTTNAEPFGVARPPFGVARSPFADVEENSFELDPEVARPLGEDVSPKIEDMGSAKKSDREEPEVPLEEVNEVADAAKNVEPDEAMASLETMPSHSAEVQEKLLDVDDKSLDIDNNPVAVKPGPAALANRSGGTGDVAFAKENLRPEDPANLEESPKTLNEASAEKGEIEVHEAPVEEGHEVAETAINAEPDVRAASLKATPSTSVHGGVKSTDLEFDDARALNEHTSPLIDEGGSGENSDSEAPETAVVEEHGLAGAITRAALEDDVAGLEAALSPSSDVAETSVKLDSEDVGAVSDDVSTVIQDEESADKGDNDAPVAPVEGACEIPEAKMSAEPDVAVGSLDAEPPPSAYVGVKSAELDSEGTRALNADNGPPIQEEEPAEKGNADAAEAPLQEAHDVAAATSSVEADPDAAGLEAAPSPSADVGDKSVEQNFEGAGAESDDASLKSEGEGSAKKGESTTTEAPAKEANEPAGVAPNVELEEDSASVDAPPSSSVGLTSVEADAGDAGMLNENVSPRIEDEGSVAGKGESEEIAPAEDVNEVAEPVSTTKPLEAAPPPFVDVEEKSLELDPEVARGVSEDVSPEIEDEGLAAENGESEAPAPVVQLNEVAEAARDFEPDDAMANLETMPSPSAEVQEQPLDVDDKSLDIGFKPVAGEPEPADLADRSGGAGDVAFARDEFYAEDPAIVKESPEILDEASAEQGEIEAHEAPVEEGHEVAETAINAEPDARVASVEATPSPSAHAGGISAQPESDNAVAVGVDVSLQFEDDGSGENGDSEAPEAGVDEVQEVAEATSVAEPAEDASRLDSAISPSLGARERSVEMDSEDSRADASVDVSQNFEDAVLADKGNSAAPEASVEEVCKIPSVTTSAEHNEVEANLETEPSPSVNAGERNIELDHEEAGAVIDDVRPVIKDEECDKKGDSAVPGAPVEVDQDVAKSSTGAEPDEAGASLDAKPLPYIDVRVTSIELDSEETRALNDQSSPLIETGGLVDKVEPEAAKAPMEQIHEVAGARSSVEHDKDGASLDAAISPSFNPIERPIELGSEDAEVASEDASFHCEDGVSADKVDNEAAEAHDEETLEVSVATTSAESGDDPASEAAISPSVDIGDEGTADNGESDTLDVPTKEVRDVAEAAIHADPEEGAASPEAVPSHSADVEEKLLHEEESSVDAESKPVDIDYHPRDVLPYNSVGIDDKIVEVKFGDVDVGRDDLPAEIPANEDVSPPFPNDESTEKDYFGAPPAPLEVANEVAEATTPVERDEAVSSREAAAPRFVDVQERCFEQDSTDAGALNVDLRSQNEDAELAKIGDSLAAAAAEAPQEKFHEVVDVPTSAKADEYATSAETAPSPSLDFKEKSVELGSEVAGAGGENFSPITKHEGTTVKVEHGARKVPVEEVNKVVNHEDPTEVISLEAAPIPSVGAEEKTVSVEDVSDHKPGDVADKSDEIAEVDSTILQATPPHSRERSIELDSKAAADLNEGFNRQSESSISDEKGDNEGTAPEAPAEEVSEVITATSEPDDVGAKSSGVRSEDAKAVSKDVSPHAEDEPSRRPRKFRWVWWGLGTVVLSAFVVSLFAIFSGQTGGLAVPFQVLPFLP